MLIFNMTRGLITVPDEPMVEPAAYENTQSPPKGRIPVGFKVESKIWGTLLECLISLKP